MGVVGHPEDSLNLTEMFRLALIEFSVILRLLQRKFYQSQTKKQCTKSKVNRAVRETSLIVMKLNDLIDNAKMDCVHSISVIEMLSKECSLIEHLLHNLGNFFNSFLSIKQRE